MTTNETTTNAPGRRRWAALAVCCLAAALLGIDNSVLNYAIPSLTRDLRPSGTQILWIADAYGFAMGSLLVVMGNLGDRFGSKRLALIGAALFGAISALVAYAPDPAVLIGGRAALGVAGAMISPATLSLLRHTFTDPRERSMAVGISGGTMAASFALGPVVGGFLLDRFWWGSAFLINVPVMAVVLVAGALVWPGSPTAAERAASGERPARPDWPGTVLSVLGLLGVIYAIKTGARAGAERADVWAAGVFGVLALWAFVRRQRRTAHPLVDVRLFANRAFSGCVAANVVVLFASSTLSLAFALYFQVVRGWSPLVSGLALLPGPLSAAFAAPLAGALVPRLGRARVVALGLVLLAASTASLGMVGPHSSYWLLLGPLLVNGTGIILVMAVTSDTLLAVAPRDRAGAAAAISETSEELGGALGIAILGSVLTAVYRSALRLPAGLPGGAGHAARQSVSGAAQVAAGLPGPSGDALTRAACLAFTHSLHITTLAGAALLAVGALAALRTLRDVPAVLPDPDADPGAPAPRPVTAPGHATAPGPAPAPVPPGRS
jgi:DHA2 family multidrug resistance protein-like MFS transporter